MDTFEIFIVVVIAIIIWAVILFYIIAGVVRPLMRQLDERTRQTNRFLMLLLNKSGATRQEITDAYKLPEKEFIDMLGDTKRIPER